MKRPHAENIPSEYDPHTSYIRYDGKEMSHLIHYL